MTKEHQYKTAFISSLGQFCYQRMGQGLTGGPATYTRLKDLVTGPIPSLNQEPALSDISDETMFGSFMDDDFGGASEEENLFNFLHNHYFPRQAWARLTFSPPKCRFFVKTLDILGHLRTVDGLRPSISKMTAIRDYPDPTTEDELLRFLYMLPFLKSMLPGRADLCLIMKRAIITSARASTRKSGPSKCTSNFEWNKPQKDAFQQIKHAITSNTLSGGRPDLQYHLATDASKTGIGGVLFQLPDHSMGTIAGKKTIGAEAIVMFLSFRLEDRETRYHTTEREALAVVRCLKEVRWLVLGSAHPVLLYTDHQALVTLLKSDETRDRIACWQYQLSEYNVEYIHVP